MRADRKTSPRRHYPTKADTERLVPTLVAAAIKAGLKVNGIEIGPDGAIRTLDTVIPPASAYERWKAGQTNDQGNS